MPPARSTASDIDAGRRVGKYEIITRLSVGGMAELFLAFLPGPGGFKKFVALKQILPDVKADDSFVKMFLDEARITAALNHSNIGQVFDLGQDGSELYLAMEFISGQNLEQTLKRAAKREVAIPVGFAARVIRDTAMGLHYAHNFTDPAGQPLSVVHRDVSPKNVMITWSGQVKVIDFGIAKARGRLNRTQVGVVKGTSGYMSPEQVRNEQLDGRTDLFAAAVMLHELLCGERLFTGPTDAAMMLRIVDGEADPPISKNPYVSQQLSDVVLKALSKKRDQRFATGRDFARAIEQSCPELFEDEQVTEFMGQLFEDKIAITRSLLEQANANQDVHQVVAGLTAEDQVDAKPSKKTGPLAQRSTATPAPRQGVKQVASSGKLPRVSTNAGMAAAAAKGGSSRNLPQVKPSSRNLPQVKAGRSSMRLQKIEEAPPPAEIGDETLPPSSRSPFTKKDAEKTPPPSAKSQLKLQKVKSDPARRPVESKDAAPEAAPPPPKKGGLGGVFAVLTLLAIFGGLGWAVTMGPLKEKFEQLKAEDAPPPVDTGPKKIEVDAVAPTGPKPAWLVEREKQKAIEEAERARQAEIEEAANDPEAQARLAELEAQIKQLDYLEAQQRSLLLASKQGNEANAANTKRIDELEKQIADLKEAMEANKAGRKKPAAGTSPAPDGTVQIVKDDKAAKAAALGYLTLRTISPSSAAVLLGGDSLGSTPLVKVPMEVGVHRLVVIDGDGKSRMLSVTIKAGATSDMSGVNVGSLPLAP